MPVNAAELLVKIGADTKDLKQGVSEADGVVGKLGGTLGTVATVGIGTMITGAAALTVGIGSSVKVAADFEQGLSNIQAVSGATAQEMDQIGAKALQIGKDTSFSATEAEAAIEELIKAGISIPDVMNGAADSVVALAAAGGVKIPEAATLASNAMNQFHISADGMKDVVNQIAGVANASAIDVGQFGYSLQAVGAVANLAGVSFKDTATAIGLLGNAGIVGSDAGTSLKSMFQNLIPTTKPAIKAFQELGLFAYKDSELMAEMKRHGLDPVGMSTDQMVNSLDAWIVAEGKRQNLNQKGMEQLRSEVLGQDKLGNAFFDQTGKLKSLSEVSGILQNAMKGLTKEQQQMYLTTIFGRDGIRAAAILADQGSEGFDKLAKAMGAVSAEDVAGTRLKNTKGSMESLKGSLETLQIVVGRAFLPMVKAGIDGSISFLAALMPIAEKAAPMIAAAIGNARTAINGFVSAVAAQAIPILKQFGQWFMSEGVPMIQGFVQSGIGFIQSLIPYVQQLAQSFVTNVLPALQNLGRTLVDTFQRVLPVIQTQLLPTLARIGDFVVTTLLPAIINLAAWITANFIPMWINLYSNVLSHVVTAIGDVAAWVTGTLIPALQTMYQWFSANVLPVIQSVAGFLSDTLGPALQAVGGWIMDTVVPALRSFAGFLSDNVGPAISAAVGWFRNDVGPVLRQVADWFNSTVIPAVRSFVDFLNVTLIPVIRGLVTFFRENWKTMADVVLATVDTIKTIVQTGFQIMLGAVQAILKTLGDAVRIAWDTISTTIDNALNVISGIFDIFTGVFTGDWDKAWNGVKKILGSVWDEMKLLVTNAIDAVHSVLTNTLGLIGNTWDTAWGGVKRVLNDAWNATGGLVSLVADGLQAIWNGVKERMTDMKDNVITPIWNGIKDLFENGKTAVKNALFWPFEQARDGIGAVMNAFKSNMAGPWNAAAAGIEGFINGVRDAVNWVGGKLGAGNVIQGSVSIPRFALGGLTPGGPIIAGEQGPELIMPPGSSRVFTAAQTREIFAALHGGQYPQGNLDVGVPSGAIGLGGPFDWAKDKVKGIGEAVASEIRGWIAKGAKFLLDTAMSALGVGDSLKGLQGPFGSIGGSMLGFVKDIALKGIQALIDTIKDAVPAPPSAPGGQGTPPGYPGGNAIIDMAMKTAGAYGLCEQFVGDVYQRLGMHYFRASSAKVHAHMQGLNPGYGPEGAVVFWDFNPDGHVAFSTSGGFYGTVPGGTGWMPAGAYGNPAGWTTNPAYNGAVFNEPMMAVGASGQRWTMAERDAEILLNRAQAGRAADALRAQGESGNTFIFQPGSVIVQGGGDIRSISDADVQVLGRKIARVGYRQVINAGAG